MKRVMLALAIVALSALPALAADGAPTGMAPGGGFAGPRASGMMGMKRQMMRNPQHLLMMAYHKNVITFGKVLEKAAQQGDTVPPDLARTAIAEMRRSTEEIEKHRAGALAGMPPEMKSPEMQKMMDEHLVNVKTHLRELENLAKSDRIPSQEVLKHVQAIFHGCQGACELIPGRGMGMQRHWGTQGRKGMHCCGCQCGQCGPQYGAGAQQGAQGPMMQQHLQMMQEMTQKLKAQDQELMKRVEKMKRAPKDKKVDQLADIVSSMVQQRAAMTAQMEKMQKRRMMIPPPSPTTPAPVMKGAEQGDEEPDADDMDMGDMDMQDEE